METHTQELLRMNLQNAQRILNNDNVLYPSGKWSHDCAMQIVLDTIADKNFELVSYDGKTVTFNL